MPNDNDPVFFANRESALVAARMLGGTADDVIEERVRACDGADVRLWYLRGRDGQRLTRRQLVRGVSLGDGPTAAAGAYLIENKLRTMNVTGVATGDVPYLDVRCVVVGLTLQGSLSANVYLTAHQARRLAEKLLRVAADAEMESGDG